jgi:peptidoglycan-associated lipoprotein
MRKSYLLIAIAAVVTIGCSSTKSARKTTWTASTSGAEAGGLRDSLGMEGIDTAQLAAIAAGKITTINFELDSYTLTRDAREKLRKNADLLGVSEGLVIIQGHADERGTEEYNLALSERRAVAVREYYRRLGVPTDRMKTIAYGELKPLCTDATTECWDLNRRARTMLNH